MNQQRQEPPDFGASAAAFICRGQRRAPKQGRWTGFTLLETILALSLSVLIVAAIAMAIDMHLKVIDTGWGETERNQLARAVLNRMADDIRAGIRYEKFDASGLAGANSAAQAVGEAAAALTGSAGSATSGQAASGQSAGGQNSTSAKNSSSSSSSQSTTPQVTSAEDQQIQTPGLYGDATRLNVDISRLPRADELAAGRQPSDIQTVRYYLGSGASEARGLLRAAAERATSVYSYQSGGALNSADGPQSLAPEVTAVEFQYFDGVEWTNEWDSVVREGLPMAVAIKLEIGDPNDNSIKVKRGSAATAGSAAQADPSRLYRLLVRLPAAEPTDEATMSAKQSNSQSQTNSSSSGSASGSQGTPSGGSSGASGGSSSGAGR